jgi:hypothetical protein
MFKFPFPIVFTAGATYIVLRAWLHPENAIWNCRSTAGCSAMPPSVRWFITAAFTIGAATTLWSALRLATITMVSDGIRVSNYFSDCFVPFTEIARVKKSLWGSRGGLRWICVDFRERTEVGRTIMFMPADENTFKELSDRVFSPSR